ncbi:MAG: hypothetical protein ACAH95_17635 [Fimbriimonas sp.]
MAVESEEPSGENLYRVGRRSLLIGDTIYSEGDTVSAAEAGNHLRALLKTRQLLPLDPEAPLLKRGRPSFKRWLRSFFRRSA